MKNIKHYAPVGYQEYKPDIGDYKDGLFTCFVSLETPYRAIFYIGKRAKPGWHYNFNSLEAMKKEINETISRLMTWEDMKMARKQTRAKSLESVRVGQLYSYSWGYDQTNVEFYQVTEKLGRKFKIQRIARRLVESEGLSSMASYVSPIRDHFIDEPILKSSLSMKFGCLNITNDEQKHYCSWYA